MNGPTSVYILACEGRVKIGIAAKVRARVTDLQMHCPLPIAIAFEREFPTRDNARRVERSLHSRFGERRIHGEWFVMDAPEAIAALTEASEDAAPVTIPGRLQSRQEPTPARPAIVRSPAPSMRRPDGIGPTWDDYEAMDDDTWNDFMRPAAAVLDFLNPDARANADRIEAELRVKYPQYFADAA